jgi:PAS domain S-box-containing protein
MQFPCTFIYTHINPVPTGKALAGIKPNAVQARTETKHSIENLVYLPAYARYLLTERLDELVLLQMQLSEEVELPLLRFFLHLPEEERNRITRTGLEELLGHLAANEPVRQIELSLERWQKNQLPLVEQGEVSAEDITRISYIRKQSFQHFLPGFTSSLEQALEIIRELDLFLCELETASTNFYMRLLRQRIDTHTHFIEKVTNTLPGIIYVYDVVREQELYANQATGEFLGYTPEDLTALGSRFVEELIHPEDLPALRAYEQEFNSTPDGEIRSFKYRIRNKQGDYRWLRTYESVFRRDAEGRVTEKIGIAIDVHPQQLMAAALRRREEELLEAQEIAQMGSFVWDFEQKHSQGSPQCYAIFEVEVFDADSFWHRVHPEDLERLKAAVDASLTSGHFECRYRYRGDQREKILWVKGKVNYIDGRAVSMHGTAQDVTDQTLLLQQLEEKETLYRQAEDLAGIGNWNWNLQTGQIRWTEQMYRMYELSVGEEITFERFIQFVHPKDRQRIDEAKAALLSHGHSDHTFRIVLPSGKTRLIRTLARLHPDASGGPAFIIGTEQDITESEAMVDKLRKNERIYRQAEELSNMGNWSWDLQTNTLEWTDQLYRIYGLAPQSERVTIDRFMSFVHPEDRQLVEEGMERLYQGQSVDTTFRILAADGKVRVLRSIAHAETDGDGRLVFAIGTERDITDKQNLVASLQESEEQYKQAQALARVGNYSLDLATGKTKWSDELYRIFGLEPQSEEITEEVYLSFIPAPEREHVIALMGEAIRTRRPQSNTHKIILRNGEERYVHTNGNVITDEQGREKMLGTCQDITERQSLIEKLQQSESLYKQAQRLARMGNFVWDLETNEVAWSDEVYAIYGIAPGTPVYFSTAMEAILPSHQQQVQEAIEKTIATVTGQSVHYAIQHPSGDIRYINLETDVILGRDGEVARILGTAQDVTERQELIEKLQQSQKLYQQAQSLARMGNWTYEIATRSFTWSDELFNIYEMEKGRQFTADEWQQLVHPEDREAVAQHFHETLTHLRPYDLMHRVFLPNGKIKYLHRKAEVVVDEQGRPVRLIGTTQDVTDQQQVQQELRENQMFIRKITDATPSIIASYNVNTGDYVFISEGIEKLLGYDREEALEKGTAFFQQLIHPDDIGELTERNLRAMQEANASGPERDGILEFTYRMRHASGEYRWFHTYGTVFDRNAEGRVEHVLNITLDISEQKAAIQKIAEQEHFIQQIADASPTILYLYDTSCQSMEYINREVFFVLGYLPDEIMEAGDRVTSLLYHPDDFKLLPARKESQKQFQQVDSMMQYECRLRNKEGEYRWFLVREIVFKTDERGGVRQILGAALDISRRKEMERTILQNTLQLEQSNASLEEFAYVASHDLKEPLRKISTFGDRLVASHADSLSPEGKIYLKKIVDASQRMQTMISDLLSISMIAGNRAFEAYSLHKILEETLQTLEFKIEQHNALIEFDELPEAHIIPSQFRQLFQNLLSNSLKFMREGVRPHITIRVGQPGPEEGQQWNLNPANSYICLRFTDNGIGFENEFAGKIFAIFQRLHGRSEYEGSGIGLAICKKIVEHHGGIIHASGNPGIGAVFTIILPA